MIERPFTRTDLDLLRRWDTPTICNALEIVAPARRGRGFTLQPFTAADPALPPICGLARTGQIRAAAPSGRTREQDKEARIGWYEYVADADLPTIVVIEDLDESPGFGAFWGEVNSNVHKGLGAQGCVTSGSFRDLDMLAPGFQIISTRITTIASPLEYSSASVTGSRSRAFSCALGTSSSAASRSASFRVSSSRFPPIPPAAFE